MNRRLYKPILLVVALGLLVGVSRIQQQLNDARADLGITRLEPLENMPPILAFTTQALGGFRGLIANALWVRAMELQEEGKYFEMVQLSDWISKLEPHFTHVWLVQAWNMTYNISIKFNDPEDRWRWVLRGIELLRDEGLKYNPNNTLIYRELSWFFQHKIGHYLDDHHRYYKLQWYTYMNDLFGGGHPDYDALTNPRTDEQRETLRMLRDHYKMDPEVMQHVDAEYGPLDWRIPESHAIYWAELGRQTADPEHQATVRRSIYQTMKIVFDRGAVVSNPVDNTIMFGPNLDVVANVNRAYETMMDVEDYTAEFPKTGHRNFLKKAAYELYLYNRHNQAAHWFNYLKQKYPDAVDPEMTLEEFTLEEVTEDVGDTDIRSSISVIRGLLFNRYVQLALGDDARAENYYRLARAVHNRHQSIVGADNQRVALEPFAAINQYIVDQLLDPQQSPLSAEMQARLRTALEP